MSKWTNEEKAQGIIVGGVIVFGLLFAAAFVGFVYALIVSAGNA